ncbi:hypothetical protein ACOIYL_004571, partial [Vibrio parahaemolyticus]
KSSGKSSKLKLWFWFLSSVLTISEKSKIGIVSRIYLFFYATICGFTESDFFAETLLGEFAVSKASLVAEMTFSLVW